ncbi:MAG TPA: hypothetical protein VNG51_26340 [Ktedonobacteraceae bacterium]|nr:hypothetical protein [Ktedonobacteraceae bacterium]
MSNIGKKEPEDTNENLDVEMSDLNVPGSENLVNNHKRSVTTRATSSSLPKSLFLRRKSVLLVCTSVCFMIGVIILASLSNVFSFISTSLLHPDAVIQAPYNTINATPTVFQQDGLACTINAAWSPDSKRVAVLGYSQNCTLDHYQTSLVNIYDVSTNKRLTQTHPDTAIISKFRKLHPEANDAPVIVYNHVCWSPDGSEMALSFFLSLLPNPAVPAMDGILLIKEQGEQTVLLRPLSKNGIPNTYITWDLERGVSFQGNKPFPPFPPYLGFDIAPAQAYSWKAGGLLADNPLVDKGGQLRNRVSPIGNPISGPFFTPWQSGRVSGNPAAENGKGSYMWQTSFAAWSPDERYFTDIYTGGQLLPADQSSSSQQGPGKQGSNQIPTLIMHDRALELLIHMNAQQAAKAQKEFVLPIISWRPDGRILAVYKDGQVDLYDCLSGQKIKALLPHGSIPVNLLEGSDTLSWSPNGTYLLLSSSTWGVINLWGPDQLLTR